MALMTNPHARTALPLDTFELYVPEAGNHRGRQTTAPLVSLTRSQAPHALNCNAPLLARLHHPTHVQLYWSARDRVLALHPATPEAPGALRVTLKKWGDGSISLTGCLRRYGLPATKFQVRNPTIVDGAVLIPWPAVPA